MGFRPLNEENLPSFRRSLGWSILGVTLLMVPLGYVSYLQIREANTQAAVEQILTDGLDPSVLELEDVTIEPSEEGYVVGFTAYVYGKTDGAADVAEIQRRLEQVVGGPVTLRARVVSSKLELITDPVGERGR